ncbi:MAG: hypothetical protein ACE5GE_11095, partial [Phycisphaerae bacterium]
MKSVYRLAAFALVCCAGSAWGADLTLSVTDDLGQSATTAAPGATINVKISGLLSSAIDNEGLALFGVDLSATGPAVINMQTAATILPAAGMNNFVSPDGLNNPTTCVGCFGYGGTAILDSLVQIGGGMNTIGNTIANAPFPIGTVDLAVAHALTDLATGTLTMPATPGVYSIDLSNGFANVITLGEVGPTVFATEAVPLVNHNSLTVTVQAAGCLATAARSCQLHTEGRLCLDLDVPAGGGGSNVEPRLGQPNDIEIDIDVAPASVAVASVDCTDNSAVTTSHLASVATTTLVGNTVNVTFAPVLPDNQVCVITLDCGASVCVPGLRGDVDRNGTV